MMKTIFSTLTILPFLLPFNVQAVQLSSDEILTLIDSCADGFTRGNRTFNFKWQIGDRPDPKKSPSWDKSRFKFSPDVEQDGINFAVNEFSHDYDKKGFEKCAIGKSTTAVYYSLNKVHIPEEKCESYMNKFGYSREDFKGRVEVNDPVYVLIREQIPITNMYELK